MKKKDDHGGGGSIHVDDLVSLRKTEIDIRAIQERLREIEGRRGRSRSIWDPREQTHNVPIRRAGHDGWGIGKIIFIFADDYLQNVYLFPWLADWKDLLDPIFRALGVHPDQVCVLVTYGPMSCLCVCVCARVTIILPSVCARVCARVYRAFDHDHDIMKSCMYRSFAVYLRVCLLDRPFLCIMTLDIGSKKATGSMSLYLPTN